MIIIQYGVIGICRPEQKTSTEPTLGNAIVKRLDDDKGELLFGEAVGYYLAASEAYRSGALRWN